MHPTVPGGASYALTQVTVAAASMSMPEEVTRHTPTAEVHCIVSGSSFEELCTPPKNIFKGGWGIRYPRNNPFS